MRIPVAAFLMFSAVAALAAETPLRIPSDAKAQYFVLEKGGTKNNPTMITKRVGPSGTSYSQRIFDCSLGTAKYLGTGASIDAMKKSPPDPKMGPLVEGSIAWYQWRYACGK